MPILLLLLPVFATFAGADEPPARPTTPTVATRIDLRVAPLVELYFAVRAAAAEPADAGVPDGFEAAVTAARQIQGVFGSFGGWGPIDGLLLTSTDAADFRRQLEGLPDPIRSRRGGEVERARALTLADALAALEPAFLAEAWPRRRAALEASREALRRDFLPDHQRALADMMSSLAIADPGVEIPVYLVSRTNPPGAMTYFLEPGEPATVVGLEVGTGGVLFETLLHESTHALDIASQARGSVFETLRQLLLERSISPRDRLFESIPHTLMFIQAAATVRRVYDAAHVDYGVASGVYERSGEAAEVERAIWPRVLAGELDRDAALKQIVDALAPPPRRTS